MVINLYALTMLDGGPSMICRITQIEKTKINPQIDLQKVDCQWSKAFVLQAPYIKTSIKYKVGYTNFNDKANNARHKISNMRMNGCE